MAVYFFVRTINPRPTFAFDMTEDELSLMTRHVAYWVERAKEGVAVVFGPVLDPAGAYGVGIYRAADEATMRQLMDADPAADLLQCTLTPMGPAIVGHEVIGNGDSSPSSF